MIICGDDIRLVAEAKTSKELVECLRTKFTVSSSLCYVGGIPWEDVWAAIHVLVDVL